MSAQGHAGAAEKGQDIVCAALSILMQTLADTIEGAARDEQLDFCDVNYQTGQINVDAVAKPEHETMLASVYEFVVNGLSKLAVEYPDYVRLILFDGSDEAEETEDIPAVDNGTDLQYFADGGTATGADGTATPAAEDSEPDANEMTPAQRRLAMRSGTLRPERDTLKNVVYGKQPEAAAPSEANADTEETAQQPTENTTEPTNESEADRIRRERAAARDRAEQQIRGHVQAIRADWDRQAAAMQEKYPSFNYSEARSNPAFADLMKRGVNLETAYRAVYFDRLMRENQATTAQAVERGVTERIATRNARPGENGTRPSGAVTMKTDVNSLSKADREEIERRVMHGEKISF
jgi:uncharacterized protein YsxB (DUF464 family)